MSQINNKTDKSRVWLFIILIIAGIVVYFAFTQNAEKKKMPLNIAAKAPELIVNVLPLQSQNVVVKSSYIGYVTPIKSVDIVPNITGYLSNIFVSGGQEVKAGNKLIKIDPQEYQAQLNAAKASVVQAQANFSNAQIYYQRIQKAGIKAISKTEIDNAKAKYLSAQGALSQALANQQLAEVNLAYTNLDATIDGIVGNVNLTKGNYVSPSSSPLLKIIQYNPIRVVFSISDKEYLDELARQQNSLFAGEKIQLRLANGQIYNQDGEFRFTDNEINKATNSIAIYADFANENKTLVANAYVDIILERLYHDKVLINQKYVTLNDSGSFVYIMQGQKLKKIPLNVKATVDDSYLIDNKFAPDEFLVIDKIGRIAPDTKFIVKNAAIPTVEKK